MHVVYVYFIKKCLCQSLNLVWNTYMYNTICVSVCEWGFFLLYLVSYSLQTGSILSQLSVTSASCLFLSVSQQSNRQTDGRMLTSHPIPFHSIEVHIPCNRPILSNARLRLVYDLMFICIFVLFCCLSVSFVSCLSLEAAVSVATALLSSSPSVTSNK